MAVLMAGCTSSASPVDEPTPEASTTVPPRTSTTTSTTTVELTEDERAIAAARQAVIDADVMGADFANSSVTEVAGQGDTRGHPRPR